MSGKSKQQRTKGNVKPASSARTAELLASSSASSSLSGVGGLAGTTLFGFSPAVVGLADQTDEVDSEVNSEISLILKKLSKRDTATKLKALQELRQLCQSLSSDDVIKALSYWPRLFNKLAIDVERRVREATHCAHEQICIKAGRQLAVHLRVIMPCWLCTMNDPHLLAAKASQAAFTATLTSDSKRADALVYCKDAIFNYISENLFEHTPSTLSDPKSTTPEEMQGKYDRMVATSLLAVSYLLQHLPTDKKAGVHSQIDALFVQPKLWKYSKSKVPSVRVAVYRMIAAACQHVPSVVASHAKALCPVALMAVGETERAACAAAWEAALHVMTKTEDCWCHVNIRKAVLPRVWSAMVNGAASASDLIYPNLLPLLGQLPEEILSDGRFFVDFFSKVRRGLETIATQQNSSFCDTIVTSYFECFRYALLCKKTQHGDTSPIILVDARKCLLCDHLLKFVEDALFEPADISLGCLQLFFASFADLVGVLVRKSQSLSSEFWTNLKVMAMRSVDELGVTNLQPSNRLMSFLKELCTSCDDVEASSSSDVMLLYEIIQEVVNSCRHLAFTNKSHNHMSLLASIFQTVSNPTNLLQSSEDTGSVKAVTQFVSSQVIPYIQHLTSDSGQLDTCMAILLALLKHTDEHHIATTFNTLIQAEDINHIILSVAAVVKSSLSSSSSSSSSLPVLVRTIKSWLMETGVTECIIASIARLTQELDNAEETNHDVMNTNWKLLELAVVPYEPDQLVSRHCRLQVLQQVLQFLDKLDYLETVNDGVHSTTTEIMRLLQARFEVMSVPSEEMDLKLACKVFHLLEWDNAKSAWKTAAKAMQHLGRDTELLQALCKWVKDKVLESSSVDLVTVVSLSLKTHQLFQPFSEPHIVSPAVQGLLPLDEQWAEWREANQDLFTACQPFIVGSMNLSSVHRSELLNVKQESNVWVEDCRHFYWSVFLAQLLHSSQAEDEAMKCSDPIELSLIPTENIKKISLELLWQLQVRLNNDFGRDKTDEHVLHLLQTTSSNVLDYIGQNQQADDLFYMVAHRSNGVGGIWPQVQGAMFTYFISKEIDFDSYLHTSLMCSKHKISACELQSIQMLTSSLEEALSAATNCPSTTSTAELFTQQLLTSPIAKGLFHSSAALQLDACLSGLCLAHCSLRLGFRLLESFNCQLVTSQIIDQLIVWRDSSDAFLFDSSILSASSVQLAFNSEACRFLNWTIRHYPKVLIDKHWDFVFCGLVSWLQTCSEGFGDAPSLGYQALTYQVMLLLAGVSKCLQLSTNETCIASKIISDFHDYFSGTSYAIAFPMFLSMAETSTSADLCLSKQLVMCAVSQAIIQCPLQCLEQQLLSSNNETGNEVASGELPQLHGSMKKYSKLLASDVLSVQGGGYECLKKLVPIIVRLDTAAIDAQSGAASFSNETESDANRIGLPKCLLAVISDTSHMITDLLGVSEKGERVSFARSSLKLQLESGCVAYCLCWLLILDCFQTANHVLRVHYSYSAKEGGRLSDLMQNLFAFMPDGQKSAIFALQGDCRPSSWDSPPATGHTNFWQWTQHKLNKAADLAERLSCSVYFRCLRQLPALVRQWYSSTDKKMSQTVEKFTSQFMSPLLAQHELKAIQERNYKSDNMQVRVRQLSREVVAVYTISDVSMELIVALTSSHPLTPVKVECGRRVGVPHTQWRNWMLQLTTFLSHQNGTILDGLVLWKDNLDKKFSGLDDCMICFSVIHGSNCSIPSLQCKTCKKKFHSACLYKWFSTSNLSSCPLCRNLF